MIILYRSIIHVNLQNKYLNQFRIEPRTHHSFIFFFFFLLIVLKKLSGASKKLLNEINNNFIRLFLTTIIAKTHYLHFLSGAVCII